MPRRRVAERREVLPDPIYNSTLVEKFICSMMWDGKKAVAQKIFYDSMDKIRERSGDDPLKLFKKAVENTKPLYDHRVLNVEVQPKRATERLIADRVAGREVGDEMIGWDQVGRGGLDDRVGAGLAGAGDGRYGVGISDAINQAAVCVRGAGNLGELRERTIR